MKLRNVAVAVAVLAILARISLAQGASIEGTVIGEDGKPLAGAVIKLIRTDIKQNYQCKTDKKGHFMYMGLPSMGDFTVNVEVDGKVVSSQSAKTSLSNPADLTFDLAKAKAQREAAAKGDVKAVTQGMTTEQKQALEGQIKSREAELAKQKTVNDAYNAGMTALDAKQWDQAITSLQTAADADPKQVAVWLGLAAAYEGRFATKSGADQAADQQKCFDAYQKAMELKPTEAGIHNNYGRALAQSGKLTEAQAEMATAAQLDPPGAAKYYYNLGAILVNAGQGEAAVDFFKKAINTDPAYGDAYYQLGVSLMSQASIGADGKVAPAPGTEDAFQKCVSLAEKCQFGAQAKEMLAMLGSTIETTYKEPAATKTPTKKK
ncbi:MAG: tetratricopeptide repeat protein [Bryobacteraceae bacterium]|jgi:Tfp pilus assembly protein PilF